MKFHTYTHTNNQRGSTHMFLPTHTGARKALGTRSLLASLLLALLATASLASSASAHTGEFARFNFCPTENPEVRHCLTSYTFGGKFVLGNKNTPIVNQVTIQGGYGRENETTHLSKFFGATNGVTLSKTPQPVPGGLAGIVPAESLPEWLKIVYKAIFENGLTGVNATLELAKPATAIEVSNFNLLVEEGVAFKLPVKVHLENPFLGSNCYVGSESHPITLNLTTGATHPPVGFESISGASGEIALTEEEELVELKHNILVENNFAAPGATGCGPLPFSEIVVDPILDLSVGVPNTAGHNTAKLENNIYSATVGAVNAH